MRPRRLSSETGEPGLPGAWYMLKKALLLPRPIEMRSCSCCNARCGWLSTDQHSRARARRARCCQGLS
eukprot:scaffold1880_cov115-Isochrysis_galbana.AAC.3